MALISTLQDNFNNNSIDAAKWINNGGAQYIETNSQLELSTVVGGSNLDFISVSSYDLTGSQASIKITDAGNQSLTSFKFYPLYISTVSDIYWRIYQGNILCNLNSVSATYVAATHKYLRFREAGGTVYADYSANGLSWTNFDSKVLSITSCKPVINVSSTAEASTTTAKVDDFNILPATTYFICSTTGAPGDVVDCYVNSNLIGTFTSS